MSLVLGKTPDWARWGGGGKLRQIQTQVLSLVTEHRHSAHIHAWGRHSGDAGVFWGQEPKSLQPSAQALPGSVPTPRRGHRCVLALPPLLPLSHSPSLSPSLPAMRWN